MNQVVEKIHRLSPNQLRALLLLAKSRQGILDSTSSGAKIGLHGKPLGGLFSSLSRQRIGKERLVIPWGRLEAGHGLRWKLNENLISKEELLNEVNQLIVTF